jgi:hypothetical protein
MRVTANGDTCVESLPSNSSAVVVAEAMGDASYQVKQDEAVLFKGGHIQGATRARQSCGCPAPAPVQVAKVAPPPPVPAKLPPTSGAALAAAMDESAPVTLDTHLSMEAPFVFNGEGIPPDMTAVVAHLKLDNTHLVSLQPTVLPPGKKKAEPKTQTVATNSGEEKRGVFSKIGAFFASIFH